MKLCENYKDLLMDCVLTPCNDYASPYILVYSNCWCDHVKDVCYIFNELRKHGLTAKPCKCMFGMSQVEYLGHVVGEGVVAVPEAHVQTMQKFMRPASKRELRCFLGTVSYYCRFIWGFSKLSTALTPALQKSTPGRIAWTSAMEQAFCELRDVLCNVCVLYVPSPSDVFSLEINASLGGVGAVLYVIQEGEHLPVAFFSRQLREPETRYLATELEGLAVYAAIVHFAHFLFGHHFTVITDHKALLAIRSSKVLNQRLQGWALKLQELSFDIVYRQWKKNGAADGLSRQRKTPRTDQEQDQIQNRGGEGAEGST